jgi:hypothetical protein
MLVLTPYVNHDEPWESGSGYGRSCVPISLAGNRSLKAEIKYCRSDECAGTLEPRSPL